MTPKELKERFEIVHHEDGLSLISKKTKKEYELLEW